MLLFKMVRTSLAVSALLHGAASQSITAPCEALEEAGLGSRLILPSDPGYYAEVNSWWAGNVRQNASCFILPRTTEEVATALSTLVQVNKSSKSGNSTSSWNVAVRSGGHSSTGSSSTSNGVTIDLSYMNSSSYDAETNIASIQPGGRWQNVYRDLVEQGITIAGGRDGDVGVGGFLLGGGNSYYSNQVGFGCDSVVNFEVVLADGSIVNANTTHNADLHKALKGGGNNFGIVTRYDMTGIPAPDIFSDTRFYTSDYASEMLDAVVGFADTDKTLAQDSFFTVFTHDTSYLNSTYVTFGVLVNTQGIDHDTPFRPVQDLPALFNSTATVDIATAAAASQVRNGTYNFGETLTFKNTPDMAQKALDLHTEFISSLSTIMDPDDFFTQLILQPLPSYRFAIGKENGGNVLGLENITQNALLWTAGVGVYSTDSPLAEAEEMARQMADDMQAYAKEVGADMEFVYMNYADSSQDPIATYGEGNVQFMRDVAAKYDPSGVFQTLVSGGFKIPKA
ncbi:FAD-binding domain-containing protein [Xylariaceae sp. FL1019]|nr:FAD-binding domain-containing protein [Xylariaceae sp. FL1019]